MKKKVKIFLIILFCYVNIVNLHSQNIDIRLSYKVILDPTTGQRPFSSTDQNIQEAVSEMNNLMGSYWRGYQFQIINISEIGGVRSNISDQWFDTDFGNDPSPLENAAQNSPGEYNWLENGINIYINNAQPGGVCSFPANDEIIVIGGSSVTGWVILHEIGHFFDLCHTQGCACGCCSTCDSPESDDLGTYGDDTLPDRACWDRDDIAQNAYGEDYSNLTNSQQQQVDNVFSNVMSYRASSCGILGVTEQSFLTESQLDKWADAMDDDQSRRDVRSGDSWFIRTNGANGNGTAENPFNAIEIGVNEAEIIGGDIIYFRDGNHDIPIDNYIIDKPVTLRATRKGTAIIGQQ